MFQEFVYIFGKATLTLPSAELCVLLAALTICLVFRMARLGLVLAFVFIYRWCWMLIASQDRTLVTAYAFFGIAVLILTVVGMVAPHRKD